MRKASLGKSLRYQVDNFLAKGSGPLFIALIVAFLGAVALMLILRLIFGLFTEGNSGVIGHAWLVFLELTDPGAMSEDTETPGIFKIAAILTGMTGVVIFSALIAFITTALEEAINNLKRGHSEVLEEGHTLIIGWGTRVVEILRELVEANESESDPVVVILAERSKEEMDEYLREHFHDRRNTRIVTRSGSTSALLSLERVSTETAKSIIVLAAGSEAATPSEKLDSDAKVIKSVLAAVAYAGDRSVPNIVAEIFDERNRQVVVDIAPDSISTLDSQELLAKIMVQTSRTSGLSIVYSELMSFDGCEMYFAGGEWNGTPFGQAMFHFPDGVPIGIRYADHRLEVRPDPATKLGPADEILIIAEDDSTIEFRPKPVMQPRKIQLREARINPVIERQLILGWSPKAPIIISEYADYVLEGSLVDVVLRDAQPEVLKEITKLNEQLPTLTVNHIDKNPLDVKELESIRPFTYHNVIILPQRAANDRDAERVDSETIIVLLHLRKLQAALETWDTIPDVPREEYAGIVPRTKLITEVLDSANQELITRAGVDDFIISNRLVSMLLAQMSEDSRIQAVYDDLFQEEGSEIYVKPAWLYSNKLPMTCRFGDLMALAQKRDNEICIGYKLHALENDPAANFGVKLIPFKDTEVTLGPHDGIVVVAEDDQ